MKSKHTRSEYRILHWFVKNSGWIKKGMILLLVIVLAWCVFKKMEEKLYPEATEAEVAAVTTTAPDRMYVNGKWYEAKENLNTVLLIGVDSFGAAETESSGNNNRRSDFLMVLVEDTVNKEYFIIHLNRDTMVNIPVLALNGEVGGYAYGQLALAFSYGEGKADSCKNVCNAVSELLMNRKINSYVAMTMDVIPILNDAVGGVPVLIEDDFTGVDDTLIKGQTVLLQGQHAFNYVYNRKNMKDTTNANRMLRHKNYVLSWMKQYNLMRQNGESLVETLNEITDYFICNVPLTKLADMVDNAPYFVDAAYYTPNGTYSYESENAEFVVDQKDLQDIVMKVFYQEIEA